MPLNIVGFNSSSSELVFVFRASSFFSGTDIAPETNNARREIGRRRMVCDYELLSFRTDKTGSAGCHEKTDGGICKVSEGCLKNFRTSGLSYRHLHPIYTSITSDCFTT